MKKFRDSKSPKPRTQVSQEVEDDAGEVVYEEFWQAPSRVWSPRVRQLSEAEIEAVLVSPSLQTLQFCCADKLRIACRLAVLRCASSSAPDPVAQPRRILVDLIPMLMLAFCKRPAIVHI